MERVSECEAFRPNPVCRHRRGVQERERERVCVCVCTECMRWRGARGGEERRKKLKLLTGVSHKHRCRRVHPPQWCGSPAGTVCTARTARAALANSPTGACTAATRTAGGRGWAPSVCAQQRQRLVWGVVQLVKLQCCRPVETGRAEALPERAPLSWRADGLHRVVHIERRFAHSGAAARLGLCARGGGVGAQGAGPRKRERRVHEGRVGGGGAAQHAKGQPAPGCPRQRVGVRDQSGLPLQFKSHPWRRRAPLTRLLGCVLPRERGHRGRGAVAVAGLSVFLASCVLLMSGLESTIFNWL